MTSSHPRRVLVLANRTAATPTLLEEVSRCAREQPTEFSLLIPDSPKGEHTDWTLELALPLLERAAGGKVDGLTGEHEPFEAVSRVVADRPFDLILISTLPKRVSKWLRRDLPQRVAGLGVPVKVITPEQDSLRDELAPMASAEGSGPFQRLG